ncbi:hypothetical protein [Cytobacillus firmus]|uniref:hypothetical protein n=1 Tax=Cytobacillus firmus TaxID=1399 RepID=UPI0021629499|nr:hypothetical protein [Cytobacillus firmus]MCS0670017.1 hypothetical protein [Cytobacillus firmus]
MSPKLMDIRSGEGEIRRNESEVDGYSDRRTENQEERVRSWWIFGQEKGKSGGMSPKLVDIRTREGEIRWKESEVGEHSDRRRENQEE